MKYLLACFTKKKNVRNIVENILRNTVKFVWPIQSESSPGPVDFSLRRIQSSSEGGNV